MSQAYSRLIAGLPARAAAAGGVPASARQMQQHIVQLPLANPVVAAREVGRLLESMLETIWPGGERIDALEMLGATVGQLCAGFERQLASESFPLPAAKQALAETIARFQRALAQGYALAVHELCAPAGKVGLMRGKSVALALARALQHGSQELLWRYRLYRNPLPETWRRLHAAYGFAQEAGLADKPVALDAHTRVEPRVPYLHALLMAVSNPYRFSARELNDAWDLTGLLAVRCTLNQAGAGSVAIDPASDAGPGYLPEERRAATPGLLWSFDADGARAALAADRSLQPGGATGHSTYRLGDGRILQPGHLFLDRLQSTWSGTAERDHVRLPAGHPLDACVGLHGVHLLLAGGQPFQTFLAGLRGAGVAQGEQAQGPAWASADGGGVAVLRVRVLDQSLGGYRLLWPNESGTRIRVGELVGLAQPAERGDVQDWMVGIVRWLRIEDDGKLDTGVSLLARQALPAAARAPDSHGRLRSPQRALLLVGEEGDEQLLMAHVGEAQPVALELSLPEDPRDWQPTPTVRLVQVRGTHAASPGYTALTLGTPPRSAQHAAAAPTPEAQNA